MSRLDNADVCPTASSSTRVMNVLVVFESHIGTDDSEAKDKLTMAIGKALQTGNQSAIVQGLWDQCSSQFQLNLTTHGVVGRLK